jgi:hypothetical protein
VRGLVVSLIFLLVAGCASPSPTTSPPTTATDGAPAAGSSTVAPSSDARVEILSSRAFHDHVGNYHVVGEIVNHGPKNASFAEIAASFFDAEGKPAGEGTGYVWRTNVPAGQKGPFDVLEQDKEGKLASYRLAVKAYATSAGPLGEGRLEVRNVSNASDGFGYMHVKGEVVNHADRAATVVKVIATFYNATGGVVGVHLTYTSPGNVAAGKAAPFEALADERNAPDIASFRLDVEAQVFQ